MGQWRPRVMSSRKWQLSLDPQEMWVEGHRVFVHCSVLLVCWLFWFVSFCFVFFRQNHHILLSPHPGEDDKMHVLTLKAHVLTLKAHVLTLKAHVLTLKTHVSTLKAHVSTLKAHVSTLKAHVLTLKARVLTLKAHVLTLKAHMLTLKAHMSTLKAHILTLKAHMLSLKTHMLTLKAIFISISVLLQQGENKFTAIPNKSFLSSPDAMSPFFPKYPVLIILPQRSSQPGLQWLPCSKFNWPHRCITCKLERAFAFSSWRSRMFTICL